MDGQNIKYAGIQRPFDRVVGPICLIVICIFSFGGMKFQDVFFDGINLIVGGVVGFAVGTVLSILGAVKYLKDTDPVTTVPQDSECYS